MTKSNDVVGWTRTIIALIGVVLLGGAIWASTSAKIATLEAKQCGSDNLHQSHYECLREDIKRIELKVDRLLEHSRIAKTGDNDGR